MHVFRAGAFSARLHDHRFVPTRWSASLRFDPGQPAATAMNLLVQADSLHDQEPGLSDEDHRKVDRELRGPKVLDVQRYPEVRFEAERLAVRRMSPDGRQLEGALIGWLELHGRRRSLAFPVKAQWDAGHLEASGSAVFKQSDFGISPFKKLLGTIAVRDEVQVDVHLVADAVTGR